MMQTVSLRQWLAALLPAPPETLAGGGPSRMTDDIGLLQGEVTLNTPNAIYAGHRHSEGKELVRQSNWSDAEG